MIEGTETMTGAEHAKKLVMEAMRLQRAGQPYLVALAAANAAIDALTPPPLTEQDAVVRYYVEDEGEQDRFEVIGPGLTHECLLYVRPPEDAELIAAAHAVVERWETPLWKDVPATATYINRLSRAVNARQPSRVLRNKPPADEAAF